MDQHKFQTLPKKLKTERSVEKNIKLQNQEEGC